VSARVLVTAEPDAFAAAAGGFLAAELERAILASVLRGVRRGHYHRARFGTVVDGRGSVLAAALRTPPHSLMCTRLPDPAIATPLVDAWLGPDPGVGGVSAVPETARAIASAWAASTGGSTRLEAAMAMHALREVHDPPRPAPGSLRPAQPGERALLVEWWRAFYAEAEPLHDDDAERAVAAGYEDGGMYVWDDDGAPTSLIAVRPPVDGVARIGPVYTPGALRRRGYAGSGVAAASRRLLDTGADVCMLFTDLANPTSNKIYGEVGYRRFADWEDHRFSAGPAS
jgi:predicted GNAT family acetyltransferase